jgi:hypothetical protein
MRLRTQLLFADLKLPQLYNFSSEEYKLQMLAFKGSVTRFLTSGFFHESVSPKPLSIPLGSFRIFSKIRGDIRSSRFATGVVDTGGKCKKSSIIKVLII